MAHGTLKPAGCHSLKNERCVCSSEVAAIFINRIKENKCLLPPLKKKKTFHRELLSLLPSLKDFSLLAPPENLLLDKASYGRLTLCGVPRAPVHRVVTAREQAPKPQEPVNFTKAS